jgi:hypothetical protein
MTLSKPCVMTEEWSNVEAVGSIFVELVRLPWKQFMHHVNDIDMLFGL